MFSSKELRDYAYQLILPQALHKLLFTCEEKFKQQLQYMIEQLENNEDHQDKSQLEEDNDVDDQEDDLDENDLENNDMIVVEELLKNEFALDNEQAEQQRQLMESIMQKELQQRSIDAPFIAEILAQINQKQVQPQIYTFVSRPKIP